MINKCIKYHQLTTRQVLVDKCIIMLIQRNVTQTTWEMDGKKKKEFVQTYIYMTRLTDTHDDSNKILL